jgi:cell wall-associated NlpC family hydrolase
MLLTEARRTATEIAMGFHGLPYIWGGDDPMRGFDCSGMCIEVLKSVGLLPRQGDWTARSLWKRFASNHGCAVPLKGINEGCLVFWANKKKKIIHVEYALNDTLCIGASGGGSRHDDREQAIRTNAYVKIRPFATRAGLYGAVDPFILKYGGGYAGGAA